MPIEEGIEDYTLEEYLSNFVDKYFDYDVIWKALKYRDLGSIKFKDYNKLFLRGGLASRLIKIPAKHSWQSAPELIEADNDIKNVYDSIFNNRHLKPYSYFERGDIISGIGEFGIIHIGVNDGEDDLSKPIKEGSITDPEDILFFEVYDQGHIKIREYEEGNNRRHGLPKMYQVNTWDMPNKSKTKYIHWTRVIHLADNKTLDDVFGEPRLRDIFNLLVDLEKVRGSGAEGFYRQVMDKILFDLDKDAKPNEEEKEKMRKDMKLLMYGLKSYMRTSGITPKTIDTDIKSNKDQFDVIINCICGTKGYARKYLLGAERGEISSAMDVYTFFNQMETRRRKYVEPEILNRFMDRLAYFGLFDKPDKYTWKWRSLYELSPLEKAELAKTVALTIKLLGTSDAIGSIVTQEEVRTNILGWDGDYEDLGDGIAQFIKEKHNDEYETLKKLADGDKGKINKIISNITQLSSKVGNFVK